jgi:hypothetical protein
MTPNMRTCKVDVSQSWAITHHDHWTVLRNFYEQVTKVQSTRRSVIYGLPDLTTHALLDLLEFEKSKDFDTLWNATLPEQAELCTASH